MNNGVSGTVTMGAHRRTANMQGQGRIQADERAEGGADKAASASAPELTGSEESTFAQSSLPIHRPGIGPSAALLG